ncbi:MAG: immune inhibitor A [Candidatus Promineofilum sp.]|nr:immune inhibitor A [Promineifilum sp.]MBP9657935.1 immune inhibitor A [Promineifilum sp.]
MRSIILLLIVVIGTASCRLLPGGDPLLGQASPSPTTVAVVEATEEASPAPSPSPVQAMTNTPISTSSPTANLPDATPSPEATPLPPAALALARSTTAAELVEIIPPNRDPIGLAVAYLGVETVAATPPVATNLQVGDIQEFFISNVDSNTMSVIEAELMSVGEHAYFWFDLGEDAVDPDKTALAAETKAFDKVFDVLFPYFGAPEDEGKRVHIVHAAPSRLCDVADQCSLAGYFSSRDLLPISVDPQSNERTMFVMNADQFGSMTYIDTLSHELRHLLGNTYDLGDEDWVVEGAAMLTEDLAGFSFLPQYRANQFLADPDKQLNSWQDGNTGPRYGQGYLVNRFLYDRLGAELYHAYTLSRRPGLTGVDDAAAANGLDISGEGLWLDWLTSMALLGTSGTPERYRWDGPELDPVAMTPIDADETVETTVYQYAADYYELPPGARTLEFTGAPTVSLLGSDASSGDFYWYAQRANTSNSRLTRAVDLRDTAEATLHYRVFADIEEGYDFAYVSVSTDGGRTWQGLVADGMQGLDPADDPSDSALTERYYTGRTGRWVEESIDLSSFSGQEILLRFEYVTDLILTYGGFALDDIAIPEIGFFDGGETLDSGWVAEGFTRATADLPQAWRLQLITFDADGRPTVELLDVGDDGRLRHSWETSPNARRPILIVAAVAPETLQPAEYTFSVGSQ